MQITALSLLAGLSALAMPANAAVCNFKGTSRVPHDQSKPVEQWALYFKSAEYRDVTKQNDMPWPPTSANVYFEKEGSPKLIYTLNPEEERCWVRVDVDGRRAGSNTIQIEDKGDYTEYTCHVLNFDCA